MNKLPELRMFGLLSQFRGLAVIDDLMPSGLSG